MTSTWSHGWTATTGTPILGRATRDIENWQCDTRGYGMGYGVVYDTGDASGPEEYRTQIGGATLNGAFTLWVRRPVKWNGVDGGGTQLEDYPNGPNDVLMLVSEGVAPWSSMGSGINSQSANITANAFSAGNRAVYTIEALLVRGAGGVIADQSQCNSRQGQAGGSSSGGNTAGCVSLTSGSQITEALVGVSDTGTGNLK